jgi:putative toxin-antitoxin system antitoxin component (TIGR02293 family)
MSIAVSPQSYKLITELSQALNLSAKQVGELLDIHPRTLQRRQESGSLEEAELLRAQMLDETFKLATTAFHDADKARAWLFSEIATLDFGRPVDLLKTIRGYERVKSLLGQIVFGVY